MVVFKCDSHFFRVSLGDLTKIFNKKLLTEAELRKLWESEPVCDVPGLLHQPLKEMYSKSYLLLTIASLNTG